MTVQSGLVAVLINNTRYRVGTSYSWQTSGGRREYVDNLSGVAVHKVRFTPAECKFQILDSKGLRLSDFEAMDDVSITLTLANGKTVTGTGMYCVNDQSVDAEGMFEVTFQGQEMFESNA